MKLRRSRRRGESGRTRKIGVLSYYHPRTFCPTSHYGLTCASAMAAAVRHTPRARARTPTSLAPGLGSQWCPRSEPPKMTFGRGRQRPIYYHRRREPRRLAERARRLVPACKQPHGDQCQVSQPPHLTICTCSQSGAATATVLIHTAVHVLCASERKELH